MYNLIAFISLIIRNFYLPNPFASLEYGEIINWMIEPLLYLFTFTIVGLFYQRGSAPAWGSFLYLFFYAMHVSLVMLCGKFGFAQSAIVVIVIIYSAIIIGLMILKK